jgi:hypothetical protein
MAATPRVSVAAGFGNLLLVLVCINALGWLTARHLSLPAPWAGGAGFGLASLALLGMLLLMGILHVLNPDLARRYGPLAALVPVASGMLLVVPFTVLALIAELVLHWSAAQAFATAGVMTGAAAIGMETSRLGSARMANSLVPSLAGGLFVAAWMLTNALLPAVIR